MPRVTSISGLSEFVVDSQPAKGHVEVTRYSSDRTLVSKLTPFDARQLSQSLDAAAWAVENYRPAPTFAPGDIVVRIKETGSGPIGRAGIIIEPYGSGAFRVEIAHNPLDNNNIWSADCITKIGRVDA